MYDKRIFDVVSRWESLGWFDKKRIWWISFWAIHKISPKKTITAVVFLSVLGVQIGEHNIYPCNTLQNRIVLLAFLALFYFYALMLDEYYKHHTV
jgi:hypothetical protein